MTTISDFRAQLKKGGARSNQFTVELTFPTIAAPGSAAREASFLCNATSVPAVTIDNIPLSYRGRPVNVAGERSFAPWSITVINDNYIVRDAFERWSNAIANFDATEGLVNPETYQVDLRVIQLDRNGEFVKSYKFYDAYPIELGTMGLAYDNPQIQTFDVVFQYNWYRPEDVAGQIA